VSPNMERDTSSDVSNWIWPAVGISRLRSRLCSPVFPRKAQRSGVCLVLGIRNRFWPYPGMTCNGTGLFSLWMCDLAIVHRTVDHTAMVLIELSLVILGIRSWLTQLALPTWQSGMEAQGHAVRPHAQASVRFRLRRPGRAAG
jgi:hypothetical protein